MGRPYDTQVEVDHRCSTQAACSTRGITRCHPFGDAVTGRTTGGHPHLFLRGHAPVRQFGWKGVQLCWGGGVPPHGDIPELMNQHVCCDL